MTASRFAYAAVAFWLLGNFAQAQRMPVVQVAAAIEIPTDSDVAGVPTPTPRTLGNRGRDDLNRWVLTDESIDAIAERSIFESQDVSGDQPTDARAVTGIAAGQCECGQTRCHGVCRDPGHPKKPRIMKPGDRDRGDCPPLRYRMNDCERAGNPHGYHRWAKCSVDDQYSAWFVGGGSPFPFARGRTSSEGTWGLDYAGLFGHAKVWLNYTHGRNQGGVGAYRTDGEPKIISRAHDLMHFGH